jgi:hypothetical protein
LYAYRDKKVVGVFIAFILPASPATIYFADSNLIQQFHPEDGSSIGLFKFSSYRIWP